MGISFLALVVSAIGTTSSMLLGWRAERRLAEESKLKIQQLERELAKEATHEVS